MTNKKIYFTPGPSQMYPTVAAHLQNALSEGVPSISHRSKIFESIFKECTENLRAVLGDEETGRVTDRVARTPTNTQQLGLGTLERAANCESWQGMMDRS